MIPLVFGLLSVVLAALCARPAYLLHVGLLKPGAALTPRLPEGQTEPAKWLQLQKAARPLQILAAVLSLVNGFSLVALVPASASAATVVGLGILSLAVPCVVYWFAGVVARNQVK